MFRSEYLTCFTRIRSFWWLFYTVFNGVYILEIVLALVWSLSGPLLNQSLHMAHQFDR